MQAKQNNVECPHHDDSRPIVIRPDERAPDHPQSMTMSDFLHPTVTSQATKTNEKRQLQDLSLNDAEALQAFVAKRKWFEIKLKASPSIRVPASS